MHTSRNQLAAPDLAQSLLQANLIPAEPDTKMHRYKAPDSLMRFLRTL